MVKQGDIWKFGPHKLLCGDSREKCLVDAFLGRTNPKLCVTDPPYGVSYKSTAKSSDLYNLKLKNDHIANWSQSFLNSRAEVLFTWAAFQNIETVLNAIGSAGYKPNQLITWVKNNWVLHRYFYHNQQELAVFCVRGDVKANEAWTGDRKQSTVWKIDSVPASKRIHPTEKPKGVYTKPILNHTNEGDWVIDLFAGSGVLFDACKDTKRKALGIELDEGLCNRILDRAEGLGYKPKLIKNVFSEVVA